MRRAAFLLVMLSSFALAGGRESIPQTMNHMAHSAGEQLMEKNMMDMLAPLRPLRGKAFDVKWTQLMIYHHQMALDMAQHELSMGHDPRVKAEAQKVLGAQRQEITTMQNWLKRWTGQSYKPQPMPMDMNGMDNMDKWFLEGMIPHHQGAIDMSQLIAERTHNTQVRQLGQAIIRTQSAEIAQYRQLLRGL